MKPAAGAVPDEEHWNIWRRDPRATPFQSPAWLDAWWTHLGGGERIDVAVRNADERLVALLPAFVWNDNGVRRLVPVGVGHSDYCDALVDPEEPDAVARLWRALLEAGERCDEILLPDVRADSPLLGPVPDGLIAKDAPVELCPVLHLGAGELEAVIPKSKRRKLALARNRAARLGGVGVALVEAAGVVEALDALFALHQAQWRAAGKPGVLADARVQAFHRTAAPALAQAGLLRMAAARRDGRIVAVILGSADRTRWHGYISGVDMTEPGQSFGTIAFACLLEAAIADGAREFHFLRGDEPYKFSWGAEPTHTVRRVVRRA